MEPEDDSALLRQFAENHSDEAFAELVARHVNLVYSVALRRAGHPQNAEEITQAVFIILAKKAAGLRNDKALSSWLFQATRLTAINFLRGEIRRRHREEEAQMQTMLNESGGEVWPKIAPLLDDAVAALREKERRAIVLRFYEGRSLREVGLALGASEDAAKKRVGRALEKLRQSFAKRGVDSTTTAIAETISANSILVAPAALAKTATAVALAKGATASASTLTLIKGALKIMAWTKAKTGMVGVIVIVFVLTATTVVIRHSHVSRTQTWTTNQLADAGYATPEAAMKTLLWGISRGDVDTVSGSLTPTERANAQRAFPGQFSATVEAWSKRMTATNFQIAVEGGSSDNVTIDLVSSGADGQKHERKYWFKKIGKEWKCDQVHPSFDLSN
jgi:RNA polymerase sigma factor (sigma-70 family)